MNKDQTYTNSTQRKSWQQTVVWPLIWKNINDILKDKGPLGDGGWIAEEGQGSCPFCSWLLVQHMDAFPDNQKKFLDKFKVAFPRHEKLPFLRDRVMVNLEIIKLSKKEKFYDRNNKILRNPTVDVRDPSKFRDADLSIYKPISAQQALDNARKENNHLLVRAVMNTNAKTQPSFNKK